MENNNVISIHAPLRERRQLNRVKRLAESISIHAPLRERLAGNIFNLAVSRFQSTLPYGSDSSRKYTCSVVNCHFNPRSLTGATQCAQASAVFRRHFNPRSLTGATKILAMLLVCQLFQSTLPYGSDRYCCCYKFKY